VERFCRCVLRPPFAQDRLELQRREPRSLI
jgi:hypothetical protein